MSQQYSKQHTPACSYVLFLTIFVFSMETSAYVKVKSTYSFTKLLIIS